MQGTRHFVRTSMALKKLINLITWENFFFKALFYKCFFFHNLKIISNFYLPAFLCEVLINYARNMTRIRLTNCTNF